MSHWEFFNPTESSGHVEANFLADACRGTAVSVDYRNPKAELAAAGAELADAGGQCLCVAPSLHFCRSAGTSCLQSKFRSSWNGSDGRSYDVVPAVSNS